jgi:uncharacterized protein (TIGR02246 family)
MFERYTEKARRVVFFARYEATHYGSNTIEAEHLLLGVMREDQVVANQLARAGAGMEALRRKIEADKSVRGRKPISTSVNVPLSQDCHRILKRAAEEADRLGHQHVGTEHMFVALVAESQTWAGALLREFGLNAAELRLRLAGGRDPGGGRNLDLALEEFVQAWIERNVEALMDFVQDGALLVDVRGNLHEGREAIREYCAHQWSDAENLSTLKVTPSEPRPLRLGAAVVPMLWEFAAMAAGQAPRRVRALLLMCQHNGAWRIAAAQLTEVRSPDAESSKPGTPAVA